MEKKMPIEKEEIVVITASAYRKLMEKVIEYIKGIAELEDKVSDYENIVESHSTIIDRLHIELNSVEDNWKANIRRQKQDNRAIWPDRRQKT